MIPRNKLEYSSTLCVDARIVATANLRVREPINRERAPHQTRARQPLMRIHSLMKRIEARTQNTFLAEFETSVRFCVDFQTQQKEYAKRILRARNTRLAVCGAARNRLAFRKFLYMFS